MSGAGASLPDSNSQDVSLHQDAVEAPWDVPRAHLAAESQSHAPKAVERAWFLTTVAAVIAGCGLALSVFRSTRSKILFSKWTSVAWVTLVGGKGRHFHIYIKHCSHTVWNMSDRLEHLLTKGWKNQLISSGEWDLKLLRAFRALPSSNAQLWVWSNWLAHHFKHLPGFYTSITSFPSLSREYGQSQNHRLVLDPFYILGPTRGFSSLQDQIMW